MKSSWLAGVDEALQIDIRQNFKESLVLRRRLRVLLEDKIALSQKGSRAKDSYENPNWAYLQADARGYERALSEIISLIFEKDVVD